MTEYLLVHPAMSVARKLGIDGAAAGRVVTNADIMKALVMTSQNFFPGQSMTQIMPLVI